MKWNLEEKVYVDPLVLSGRTIVSIAYEPRHEIRFSFLTEGTKQFDTADLAIRTLKDVIEKQPDVTSALKCCKKVPLWFDYIGDKQWQMHILK